MPQKITVHAYSTALFSTWVFIEEMGLLFDCGDGFTSSLLQKSRKVQHAFISHADRDHVTGLIQFNQLNGRDGLSIHYPKDAGSFPAMAGFTEKFDPHVSGTAWAPLGDGDRVDLGNGRSVRTMRNRHVAVEPPTIKSLSYVVEQQRRKLKPELAKLAGHQIAQLRKERDEDELFDLSREIEFIYSGDTPVETDGRYQNARILFHEATFMKREDVESDNVKRNGHSSLDAVMEMVADANVQQLVLGHFSSRYSIEQIDDAIAREKARCGIKHPVYVIYPGQVAKFEI